MGQPRELDVIIHSYQGIKQPPMEVSLVLHTSGIGAGVDVCQDCAFPTSPVLVLLLAPLQGETIPEIEAVPEDLVFEFCLNPLCEVR